MYSKEEQAIIKDFSKDFGMKYEKFMIMLQDLETLIMYKVGAVKAVEQDKYTTALLGTSNVKTLRSVVRLLRRGYLGDAEVLLRKATEALLMQSFFCSDVNAAKAWIGGKPFDTILKTNNIKSRKDLANKLDIINEKIGILPTEGKSLFKELVYECFYQEGSSFMHLDFNLLHHEITLDEVRPYYSSEFIMGPRYDKEMVKVSMTRLAVITSFQTLILCTTFNVTPPSNHLDFLNYVAFSK